MIDMPQLKNQKTGWQAAEPHWTHRIVLRLSKLGQAQLTDFGLHAHLCHLHTGMLVQQCQATMNNSSWKERRVIM